MRLLKKLQGTLVGLLYVLNKAVLLPLTDIVEQNKVSFSPQELLLEVTPGEVWLGEQRAIDQIFETFQKKEKTHLFDSRC